MSGIWVTEDRLAACDGLKAITPPKARLRLAALGCAVLGFALSPSAVNGSIMAFYAPWDSRASASLLAHGDRIGILAPAWISVTGPDDQTVLADAATARSLIAQLRTAPKLMPVVQNAAGGAWDGADAAALLASPTRRKALIDRLLLAGQAYGASGLVFDFEDLPKAAQPDYLALLREAGIRFAARRWTLAVAVPAADDDWSPRAYGRVADLVILMAYDEHWQSGRPGPIASLAWFARAVRQAASEIPPAKLVVGLASYAYDWPAGASAAAVSISDAEATAAAAGVTPARDASSGELHFSDLDHGVRHQVWLADASSTRAEVDLARGLGLHDFAVWRLGTEDPALWAWLGARRP